MFFFLIKNHEIEQMVFIQETPCEILIFLKIFLFSYHTKIAKKSETQKRYI